MLSTADKLMELEQTHSSGVYLKRDIQILRGEGAYLYDNDGRRYLDCVSGQGANNLGHAHPAILAAIQSQAADLLVCPELFHNPLRARYQAALCTAAQMPHVFLCNSGAEAVEAALKFARISTGRTGIVSTMRGFHGRTCGALSTTWNKAYREPFEPLLSGVRFAPYNQPEKLTALLDDTIAAVIVEVVQGEGGVHPAQAGYLQMVQNLCRENGSLLIVDEVQTGFGRTGSLFAFQTEGIQPDFVCLAKSIAGGLPAGAVLIGENVGQLPPAIHGSTFGGNPLACAAGLAVLEVLQNSNLIANAATYGDFLLEYFREHLSDRIVRELRGRGLLIGIELRDKVAPILKALQAEGLLALPAGPTVLRLLPPLIITQDQLWEIAERVERVLQNAI